MKRPRRFATRRPRSKRYKKTPKQYRKSRRYTKGPRLNVVRKFWLQTWVPTTVTTNDFYREYRLRLADLPQYTEYSNVFDRYKIAAMKLSFTPKFDNYGGDVAGTKGTTYVSYIRDMYGPPQTLTGAYSSATYNTFAENGKVHTRRADRPFSIYYKPTLVNTGISGSQKVKAQFLPVANDTVFHYGPLVFFHDANFSGTWNQQYDVWVTYYMTFKGMK